MVLGADLNGHVGEGNIGNEEIMRRYGAETKNKEGSMVMDFGKTMDLAIINTWSGRGNCLPYVLAPPSLPASQEDKYRD